MSSKERGLQTKSDRIMWLGLAFPGTRLFIQRKKKRRSLKPKNNNRFFLELHRMRVQKH